MRILGYVVNWFPFLNRFTNSNNFAAIGAIYFYGSFGADLDSVSVRALFWLFHGVTANIASKHTSST